MKIQFKDLFFNMNRELYQLLIELDYKFDYDIDDYFRLSEDLRNSLAGTIMDYFMPYIKSHDQALSYMIKGLKYTIDEAEEEEDYEKADIFNRCLNKCYKMTFL